MAAEKTIDILMNLKTKTEGVDSLVKGFKEAEKRAEELRKEIKRISLLGATKEAERLGKDLAVVEKEMRRISQEASKQALAKSIAASNQKTTQLIGNLEKSAAAAQKIGTAMIGVGALILGPLVLAMKKYVDTTGEGEATSKRIVELNKQWVDLQVRLGRVVATDVLPHLEKAMGYLDKAIAYAEANPGVISGALTIGASLVALGTLVKVVGGIIGTVSAALKIAQTLGLTAGGTAGATASAGVAGGAAGGGALATAGSAAMLIAAPIIAGVLTKELINAFQRAMGVEETTWAGLWKTALQAAALPTLGLIKLFEKLGVTTASETNGLTQTLTGLIDSLSGTESGANKASAALSGLGSVAADEAKGLDILKKLAEDEAKAKRKFGDDVSGILADSSRAITDASRSLSSSLAGVSSTFSNTVKKIDSDLSKSLSDLSTKFSEESAKAESDYQKERGSIIAAGAEEVRKIQEDAAKALIELEKDHAQNVQDLTFSRDALGLAQENKAFAEKKAQIQSDAAEAIAQSKANTAAELAEAAVKYAELKAQRLDDYNKQKAEAIAKAAEEKAAADARWFEEASAAQKQFLEKKQEIERQEAEKLADLKANFDNEQRERVIAAQNSISELGGALNAELELRRQYNQIILDELKTRLEAEANMQPAGGAIPGSASGGYVGRGIRMLGEKGKEFVMNNNTTRAAESLIGGSVTQSNLLSALARGGGSRQSLTVNDNRRFDGNVPASVRREIASEAINGFAQVLNGR